MAAAKDETKISKCNTLIFDFDFSFFISFFCSCFFFFSNHKQARVVLSSFFFRPGCELGQQRLARRWRIDLALKPGLSGNIMRRPTVAHRDLTPHAVEPSQALVTLDGFVALVALGGAVPLHPEVMHDLQEREELGVGR